MKRKALNAILLILTAIMLVAMPVLAYVYRVPYTITESDGNAYDMLPVVTDNATRNQWMADNGFMLPSANDTRIETLGGLVQPHMVTDNATLTAIAVPANSQTNLYFTTGNSESAFDIISGYGGYVTVPDSADLELADNFTIEQGGWINTTAIGSRLVYKQDAFGTIVTASGNITAGTIYTDNSTTWILPNTANGTDWNAPLNATDNDTGTYASYNLGGTGWTSFITANFTATDTLSLRYWSGGTHDGKIDIDAYYENAWHDVFNANPTMGSYQNIQIDTTDHSVTSVRVRMEQIFSASRTAYLYEIQLNEKQDTFATSVTATSVSSGEYTIETTTNLPYNYIEQTIRNNQKNRYTTHWGAGQRIDDFPSGNVTRVDLMLYKINNPTGTANVTIRKISDEGVLGIIGTIDVTTLTPAFAWYTFNTTPINIPAEQDIRIEIDFSGGDPTNFIAVGTTDSDETDYGYFQYTNGGWNDELTWDLTFKVWLDPDPCLSLYIDDVLEDRTALTSSIPDNSENWTLMQGNSIPYADNITFTINGTPQIWFQPNSMIIGDNLPNRGNASVNGTFNWGSNPAGVNVTMGGMVSESQPAPRITVDDPTIDILPEVRPSDWFVEPDVSGELLNNPIRPFVTMMSDTTTITELQAWRILALAFILLVTVATARAVRGHHFITGLACGGSIYLAVDWTIWPMWALVFVAGAIVGGIIAERAPSL